MSFQCLASMMLDDEVDVIRDLAGLVGDPLGDWLTINASPSVNRGFGKANQTD